MRIKKLVGSVQVEIIPQSLYNLLLLSAGFRLAKPVIEVMSFRTAFGGYAHFYVCPSCHVTLDREFMAYCDRCGQRLDWEDYRNAKVIFPVRR